MWLHERMCRKYRDKPGLKGDSFYIIISEAILWGAKVNYDARVTFQRCIPFEVNLVSIKIRWLCKDPASICNKCSHGIIIITNRYQQQVDYGRSCLVYILAHNE